MNYGLEKPRKIGRYMVAVVSRQAVDARQHGQEVTLICHKQAAFVLVKDGPVTTAIDMTGAKVPLAKVTAVCPEATTQAFR